MKDDDFIARRERIMLALLGRCRIWKASRLAVGVVPVVGALVMLIHCTLLSFGVRCYLSEWVFDCSVFGYVAWVIVSFAYGFCWLHRAFCTYGVAVSFCIDFQRAVGFGHYLPAMHVAMVAAGVALFAFFIRHKAWHVFCANMRKKNK